MKMTKEDYSTIQKAFNDNAEKVKEVYEYIKESKKYNVLEVRVAWECLRGLVGVKWITEQYNKGLNDTHIQTACVKALKEVIK